MDFYIAGQYKRKPEIEERAKELKALGHVCTSRWLEETFSPSVQMKEVTDFDLVAIAQKDFDDICRAETFIFFAEDQNKQPPRGGRHVELGIALAWGKDVHVIGERENVFHYLPSVQVHSSWEGFVESVA